MNNIPAVWAIKNTDLFVNTKCRVKCQLTVLMTEMEHKNSQHYFEK